MAQPQTSDPTEPQYYISRYRSSVSHGPMSKSQVSEALHRGILRRQDRLWMPGMNTWKRAGDVFERFFESDFGAHLEKQESEKIERAAMGSSIALYHDFGIASLLSFGLALLGIFFFSYGFFLFLCGPILYWAWVALFMGDRSFGMRRGGIKYRVLRDNSRMKSQKGFLRGCLSFFFMALGGAEIWLAGKRDLTLSDRVLGLECRPTQRPQKRGGKRKRPEDESEGLVEDSQPSAPRSWFGSARPEKTVSAATYVMKRNDADSQSLTDKEGGFARAEVFESEAPGRHDGKTRVAN